METVEGGPDATAATAARAPLFAAPAATLAASLAAAVARDPAMTVAATPPVLAPSVGDGDAAGAGSSAMVVTPPPRKRLVRLPPSSLHRRSPFTYLSFTDASTDFI